MKGLTKMYISVTAVIRDGSVACPVGKGRALEVQLNEVKGSPSAAKKTYQYCLKHEVYIFSFIVSRF